MVPPNNPHADQLVPALIGPTRLISSYGCVISVFGWWFSVILLSPKKGMFNGSLSKARTVYCPSERHGSPAS